MSPVLGNPAKRGKFVISNLREVLAKNAQGSDMQNLTSASRCYAVRLGLSICYAVHASVFAVAFGWR